MSIIDYFRPVDTISAAEVRTFIQEKDAGEYNLVDVRQPMEYERGHLPGARLIPLGELWERFGEFHRSRPTITY
jgi:sulfur-carrier protein adenylyltransferase/sulfurtransferase